MDVMLDLETLSTRPESVVLTMGAIKFNPFKQDDFGQTLYIRPDVDEQISNGRHVSDDTMNWWLDQPEEVREEALNTDDRMPIEEMLRTLNRFLVGVDNIWAQGPIFDIGILENLYRQHNTPPPWKHWQIRDSRTIFGTHGDPREVGRHNLHNALADCVYQAQGIQMVYHKLNLVSYSWKNGFTANVGT
jgi:hypothetical protein